MTEGDSGPALLNHGYDGQFSTGSYSVKQNDNLSSTHRDITTSHHILLEENEHTMNEITFRRPNKCSKLTDTWTIFLLVTVVTVLIALSVIAIVYVKGRTKNEKVKYVKIITTLEGEFQTDNATTQRLAKKVLFAIVDGIPADVIEAVWPSNMRKIASIGRYKRAYVGGIHGSYSETPTISAPGYMNLITGTWANKHNVFDNGVANPNYNYKNIFRLFKEQQPKKKTAIFSTWIDNRLKLIGEGLPQAGNFVFDYKFDGYDVNLVDYPHDPNESHIEKIDERVTNDAVECIREFSPDLSWIYLQYTDDVGHAFGDSAQFNQSILNLDNLIGNIWEVIEYREKQFNEDWLVIITTDHGRDPKTGKGHGGQTDRERTTWLVINTKDANDYFLDHETAIVDLLPTMARHLNISIPVESARELDGVPLIGNISLANLEATLKDDSINFSWKAFDHIGNVSIFLSTTNSYNIGQMDDYKLVGTLPIDTETGTINIKSYPSKFYKLIVAGRYNMVNKWLFR